MRRSCLRRHLVPLGVAASLALASGAPARAAVSSHPPPREYSCPIFPASSPFNRDISRAPVDVNSASYIAAIGLGLHLHADFGTNPSYGIPFAVVGPHQPKVPI